jgi:hypothetical protein
MEEGKGRRQEEGKGRRRRMQVRRIVAGFALCILATYPTVRIDEWR